MRSLSQISRLIRAGKYCLVGVAAFALGGGGAVGVAATSVPIGTLFFVSLLNGSPTTPCSTTGTTGFQTTTCTAMVDASGQLAVSDDATHQSLNRLAFDSSGNLKVAGQGTSTVTGTVHVDNLPSTQPVSGTVSVSNFPATQDVNVVGGSVGGGLAPASFGYHFTFNVDAHTSQTDTVQITATLIEIRGSCSELWVNGSGFNFFFKLTPRDEPYIFTQPLPLASVVAQNYSDASCSLEVALVGTHG